MQSGRYQVDDWPMALILYSEVLQPPSEREKERESGEKCLLLLELYSWGLALATTTSSLRPPAVMTRRVQVQRPSELSQEDATNLNNNKKEKKKKKKKWPTRKRWF